MCRCLVMKTCQRVDLWERATWPLAPQRFIPGGGSNLPVATSTASSSQLHDYTTGKLTRLSIAQRLPLTAVLTAAIRVWKVRAPLTDHSFVRCVWPLWREKKNKKKKHPQRRWKAGFDKNVIYCEECTAALGCVFTRQGLNTAHSWSTLEVKSVEFVWNQEWTCANWDWWKCPKPQQKVYADYMKLH